MPPRLMHTKSRQGCQRCKARKVKCDEATPSCGACQRHKVCCVYPVARTAAAMRSPGLASDGISSSLRQTSLSHSSVSSTATPTTPGSVRSEPYQEPLRDRQLINPSQHGVIEPRLMHYYMINYDDMFSGMDNSDIDEVWRDQVPALAFKNHFLLHAAFAVAALHGITVGPIESGISDVVMQGSSDGKSPVSIYHHRGSSDYDLFSKAHQYYFNLALQGHRQAVANLSQENADACCIATILIANQGFLLTHDLDFDADTYVPPVQWLVLAAAIADMLTAAAPMLSANAAIAKIVSLVGHLEAEQCNIPSNGVYFRALLDPSVQPDEPMDDVVREAYDMTVNLMGTIRVAIVNGETPHSLNRRFFAFAPQLPKRFIDLLHERRPRALAIFACFFAMTKDTEDIWWFRGASGEARLRPEKYRAI